MTKHTPPDILAAMLGPATDGERIVQIALDALDDNPYQERTAGLADDDPRLQELTANITTHGIHQPIIVRPHPTQHGRYQIAAGHRRRLAAHLAGLHSVPCVVRQLTDDAILDVVFAENYHRTDINAMDRARLMARLAEQGLSHQEIADRFNVSRPVVSNALRLLQLPAEIQADIAAGRITNRQAEALIPLATLPRQAQDMLAPYNNLASCIELARNGASSDSLRTHVRTAMHAVTKPLPDHWRNYAFNQIDGIQQPKCAGCVYLRSIEDSDRCVLPPCWHAKSSAWQSIENRQIVELTGTPIMSEKAGVEYTIFSGYEARILGLPEIADGPPAHQCPNLRIHKQYNGWSFICHYGAEGIKNCRCLARAEKTATASGQREWKTMRTQVATLLQPHLQTFPIDALRLLARVYGKWDQREQVINWGADQCISVIIANLIKVYSPYEPEKNLIKAQTEMTKLLAIVGLRAPWMPSLVAELSARLEQLSTEIDDFQHPGDGLPTPERMTDIIAALNAIFDSAKRLLDGDDQTMILNLYRDIWPRALTLQDRVHASYATHDRGTP